MKHLFGVVGLMYAGVYAGELRAEETGEKKNPLAVQPAVAPALKASYKKLQVAAGAEVVLPFSVLGGSTESSVTFKTGLGIFSVVSEPNGWTFTPGQQGRTLTVTSTTGKLTAQVLEDVIRSVRWYAPKNATAGKLRVFYGTSAKPSLVVPINVEWILRANNCAAIRLWLYPPRRPYHGWNTREFVDSQTQYEGVTIAAVKLRDRGSKGACPSGVVEMELSLTPSVEPPPWEADSPACTTGKLAYPGKTTDDTSNKKQNIYYSLCQTVQTRWHQRVLGPQANFAAVYESIRSDDGEGGKSGHEHELFAHLRVRETGGDWSTLIQGQRIAIIRADDTPSVQMEVVTHPGAFALTVLKCSDLVGSVGQSPSEPLNEVHQRCVQDPSAITALDSISVAPIGLHLRFLPSPDLAWLGFGVDVSALALGTSGLFTTGQTSGADLVSPFSGMVGIDLALNRNNNKGANLNVLIGGGVTAIQADGTYRPKPFFGLTMMVPIAGSAGVETTKAKPVEITSADLDAFQKWQEDQKKAKEENEQATLPPPVNSP
jgi:hypothetical protein